MVRRESTTPKPKIKIMKKLACLIGLHTMIFNRWWMGVYRPHFKCKYCPKTKF